MLALLLLIPFHGAMAKKPLAPGALTLPLSGSVIDAGGALAGTFSGTVTINRFARGGDGGIVAIGIVRGTITTPTGTVVKSGLDTVVLSVSVRDSGRPASLSIPRSLEPRLVPVSATQPGGGRFVLTQATCGILHLDLSGTGVNLLGFIINLSPITLDISGDTAGPLGALVCEIVALLGTVADVVGLLNDLLGLLTGLLGGLVGGIAGP